MNSLATLAAEAGLQEKWVDAAGEPQEVSGDTLRAVLAVLGLPAESETEICESREKLALLRQRGEERFITVTAGEPIALPGNISGPGALHLESGETRSAALDGEHLAPVDEPGYHRLVHSRGETIIAVAPPRCFGVGDIGAGQRLWGAAAQLPSLRGEGDMPFGDFALLRGACAALAEKGADLLAISPVHALFPSDASRYSPYGPSSRRFLNVLFADPSLVGAAFSPQGEAADLIDWESAIPVRIAELRKIFDELDEETRRRTGGIERLAPAEQHAHAVFEALDAHFRARGVCAVADWPEEFRDHQSPAVQAFARQHADEVAFHSWLQGLAERSLATAQQVARAAGMACGIITDLAVGVDPAGSDAWTSPGAYLDGLSVGAPPDLLGPEGQDWGLTTFNPLTLAAGEFKAFRDTLSAAMAGAGGVRIDHVLGLRRIWLVPRGRPSSEGCYIGFPQADMFRILALESWRHRAIVLGEDLGTVPEGLRDEMADGGLLGMRVLWFERDREGGFSDPAGWDRNAAAMTSTHDLPTLAGWWTGRDIDWTWQIGRKSRFACVEDERADRQKDRERLWARLVASGCADGPCPPPASPQPFVSAACAHVSASTCELALIPFEDLFGLVEQPNLPGTTDQHPNWRRRLPEAGLDQPSVQARRDAVARAREDTTRDQAAGERGTA